MRFHKQFAISLGAAALLLSVPATGQETGFSLMERELHYIAKIWPGSYDNKEQTSFDARARGEKQSNQVRLHAGIRAIDMPSLGDYVFYGEERMNDDPSKISSQRVYTLVADDKERAVRLRAYTLKSPDKAAGLDRSSDPFPTLKKRDLRLEEGCDILLRREGTSFAGQMQPGACANDALEGVFKERLMRLSASQYTVHDRIVGREGKQLTSRAGLRPLNMQRARWFACMIDVPKDTPNKSNHTQHYMTIHDQGGAYAFNHPDGRDMVLSMQNTWSYGMQRETFVIVVQEGSLSGPVLVYSWGMPGQDRIGVNPNFVRIQCDLDTPENVRLQKALRTES